MTLTEYEAGCVPMPGWQRGQAAGPAYALRQALARGETFATARDRVAAQPWHADDLVRSGQTATFAALIGP
jgi:hypothetical protein